MKSKTISIVGSGWLGKPLAEKLQYGQHTVNLSSRSAEKVESLKQEDLRAFQLDLNNLLEVDAEFWKADVFIVTITPAELPEVANLVQCMKQSNPELVIVTSSSAVYPNTGTHVVEEEAVHQQSPHSGRDVLAIEKCYEQLPVSIVRFGGLFGGERHPGRFLASGRTVPAGDAPVNMTHLEDAIGAIEFLLDFEEAVGAVNVVSPEHPSKTVFYSAAAQHLGLENPTFFNGSGQFKVVSSKRLIDLGYSFRVENPLEAI